MWEDLRNEIRLSPEVWQLVSLATVITVDDSLLP